MKILKNNIENNILFHNGFSYEKIYVDDSEEVWSKCLNFDKYFDMWVIIELDIKKLRLTLEYECGGLVDEYYVEIPDEIDINSDNFIEWIDEETYDRAQVWHKCF